MFSTKNMHSVQNEQSIEMQNYYRWIGHYENIVSDSLCDNIISTDFNYAESTYSNHGGLSKHSKERVKMDEIWIRKDNNFYNDLVECTKVISKKYYEETKSSFQDFIPTLITPKKWKEGAYSQKRNLPIFHNISHQINPISCKHNLSKCA